MFVFPSLQEGFGLPVIEAQHCGLPVICGDHSALGEITRSRESSSSAYLVDVQNPQSIAQALTYLLTHPEVYRDYQYKGFANSLNYTAKKMVSGYQKFFEKLPSSLKN